MKKIWLVSLILMLSINESYSQSPAPYGVLPTVGQLDWHEMEYFGLVCYGLNTYTEQEWAYGDVDPKLFTPTDLDTDQWARVAKDGGLKGLILVAKHHDGFCLWPSKYTDYSVKATPWKNGEGDILGDLAKSCKKYGLKLGVYLSPWDRNHAEYGRPEYVDFYYKQLEELMTEYGDVFEFWIDGANGGTGYYGGAKDTRSIDRGTYYGYEKIFSIVKENQPNAVIFSDVGPGSRWVGNETGNASETNWNTITTNGKFPGSTDLVYNKKLGTGEAGGESWIPAEADTPLSWPKAWYYHSDRNPRSLSNMVDLYYTSIGRGAALNLGLPIAPSGLIGEADKKVLINFKKHIEREFAENLVANVSIKATDSRNGGKYKVNNVNDGDTSSYWATNDNIKEASFTIDFGKETSFNRLLLQEPISLGQRIHEFKAEKETNGQWELFTEGTTIGYKRALRFDEVKASKIRVTFKTEAPCLLVSNIGIYNAPILVDDPVVAVNHSGKLSFETIENISFYYKIGEKSEYSKYTKEVDLSKGGIVYSYAKDEKTDYQTDVIMNEFGIAKDKWKVVSVDGTNTIETKKIIDNNPKSFYISEDVSNQHEVIIDMSKSHKLNKFSYLPRQDGKKEGIIFEYEFYVSEDGKNWDTPVVDDSFQNIENNPTRQIVKFKKAKQGRFIKLVSKSTVKRDQLITIAEIEVFNISVKN